MFTIKKVWTGRMGNDLRPAYEAWRGDDLIAYSRRKWLAVAVAEAIEAGHISADGDTMARFAKWAYINDPVTYDRMPEILE